MRYSSQRSVNSASYTPFFCVRDHPLRSLLPNNGIYSEAAQASTIYPIPPSFQDVIHQPPQKDCGTSVVQTSNAQVCLLLTDIVVGLTFSGVAKGRIYSCKVHLSTVPPRHAAVLHFLNLSGKVRSLMRRYGLLSSRRSLPPVLVRKDTQRTYIASGIRRPGRTHGTQDLPS